jgi:heptosyltransferase-2
MTTSERILVIGPNWVGDMVIAQALYKDLKRRLPHSSIDVVAPPWSVPLLERMPEVHRAIELPVKHGQLALWRRYRLGRRLRREEYVWSIVLPRSIKSALLPWFADVPRRTGYLGENRYGLLNEIHDLDEERMPLLVQRYVALGYPRSQGLPSGDMPYPSLRVDEDNRRRVIDRLELGRDRPVVVFAPGAQYGPAKQWPGAYFARLAESLEKQGMQIWVMGSREDARICGQIASLAGSEVRDLSGITSLQEAIDILSCAACVITNDSGLMHIAAAVGRPIVAIFGSSTPNYTPPLGAEYRTRALHLNLSCSPCFERECPLGHTHCLTQIEVDDVLAEVKRLL